MNKININSIINDKSCLFLTKNLCISCTLKCTNALRKPKKIGKFDLNYHRYMVQPLILRILKNFFSKIINDKKISPLVVTPTLRRVLPSHTRKITYYLRIPIINYHFKFKKMA